MPKNAQITVELHSFHITKIKLKILQVRLHQYMNWEPPDVQAGFRKGREARDQIAYVCWITKKQGNSKNTSTLVSVIMLKPLTMWITANSKILRWEYQITFPVSWETCMQVKQQQLEMDLEQLTG